MTVPVALIFVVLVLFAIAAVMIPFIEAAQTLL